MSIQHEDAVQIHKFAYVQSTDPGTIGAGKAWVDTSESPYKLWIRNAGNTAWEAVGLGSSGYSVYGGQVLRQIEANSNPPYDLPTGMIMGLYTGETSWRPMTVSELKLMLNIYNVPDGDARNRATHYGTQLASTISNFNSAVEARIRVTVFEDAAIVEGAGDSSVDGIYTHRGTYNSKPYYNLEGLPSNPVVSSVVFKSSYWYIMNSSGQNSYKVSEIGATNPYNNVVIGNVEEGTLVGPAPSPELVMGGLSAIRKDYRAASGSIGSRLIFHDAIDNAGDYYATLGVRGLPHNKQFVFPYGEEEFSGIEDLEYGPYDTLVSEYTKQPLHGKEIYMNAVLANNEFQGHVIKNIVLAGNIARWECAYVTSTGLLAIADAVSSPRPAMGIQIESNTTGGNSNILTMGTARSNTWSWTPGAALYLGTTPGSLTEVAPSGSGNRVQIVGRAITANTVYFNFNNVFTLVP